MHEETKIIYKWKKKKKKILQFAGPDAFLNLLNTSFYSCPSTF